MLCVPCCYRTYTLWRREETEEKKGGEKSGGMDGEVMNEREDGVKKHTGS